MKYLKSNNTTRKKVVLINTFYDRKNSQKNFASSIEGLFRHPKTPIIRCDTRVPRDPEPHPGRTNGGEGLSLGNNLIVFTNYPTIYGELVQQKFAIKKLPNDNILF